MFLCKKIMYYFNSLIFLGAVTVIYQLLRFLSFLYLYIRPSNLKRHVVAEGYALVTGATDGIGKAIATELAANGFNLVLHGRNEAKLDAVKHQISQLNPAVRIITVCQDGSHDPVLDIAVLEGLTISVLVNNVGIGPMGALKIFPLKAISDTVNLNVLFPTYLTRAVLASAKVAPLIINVSSYAGIFPPPYLSVYAATKAYNNAFSKALSVEIGGASVISVLVGSVHTAGNQKPVSFLRPEADKFAKCVLAVVGTKRKTVYPYWPHAVQSFLIGRLPTRLIDHALRSAMAKELLQNNYI
jgi:17beta-estradiol 17-dehydrogenase / very-long-chain 3-oxoacyl-CoA reductase